MIDKELLFDLLEKTGNDTEFHLELFLDLFGEEVRMNVYMSSPISNFKEVPDEIVNTINRIKAKDHSLKKMIAEKAFLHFEMNLKAGEYNIKPSLIEEFDGDRIAATKEHFKIFTPDDAFDELVINNLTLYSEVGGDGQEVLICSLYFSVPWEEEHGFGISIKNGLFHSILD